MIYTIIDPIFKKSHYILSHIQLFKLHSLSTLLARLVAFCGPLLTTPHATVSTRRDQSFLSLGAAQADQPLITRFKSPRPSFLQSRFLPTRPILTSYHVGLSERVYDRTQAGLNHPCSWTAGSIACALRYWIPLASPSLIEILREKHDFSTSETLQNLNCERVQKIAKPRLQKFAKLEYSGKTIFVAFIAHTKICETTICETLCAKWLKRCIYC